jgi:hypothetical protein
LRRGEIRAEDLDVQFPRETGPGTKTKMQKYSTMQEAINIKHKRSNL